VSEQLKAKDMTSFEVITALQADDLRNRVRGIFSKWHATIEQDAQQRKPGGPIEWRRMELQAAEEIIKLIQSEAQS
jgi:hypothetical protein